jgi:transcriptional regulator with XRE-family HTH domain
MSTVSITSRQIRAARGLVGWTQSDLAEAAGVSRSTIAAIEKETGKSNPTAEIIDRIRKVLENSEVEFLPQEGVRVRHPTIYEDDQPDANRRLLEDIYNVSSQFKFDTGLSDILIYGLREEDAERSVGHYVTEHVERLKLGGLREKILCGPDTRTFIAPRSSYRRLSKLDSSISPIHIYGDKIAIVHWRPKEFVVSIESRPIANAARAMFYELWDARGGIEGDNS